MDSDPDSPISRLDTPYRIEVICREFEEAWNRDEQPSIEAYLDRVPNSQQDILLSELLPLEWELQGGAGNSELGDYQSRFPNQSGMIEDIFVRCSWTLPPDLQSVAETLVRVPESGSRQSLYEEIEALSRVELFDDGDVIIRQGDDADFLLVIHSGMVEVTVNHNDGTTRTLDRLGQGEMLGEMALITSQPRTANVIAVGPVVAAVLPSKEFHQLVRDEPKYSQILADLIARRLGGQQHDALTDKQLDRYRILRRLGRGGMAVVYEAVDTSNDQPVALKMMSHSLVYDEPSLERFQMEADLIERFNHPNIVTMHRRFAAFHTYFIVMEYCVGSSLAQHLAKSGGMRPDEFTAAFSQLASALRYAHREEIVHRDIKPANIMRLTDGTLKLMDFGLAEPLIAAPQSAGRLSGTPRYMAPEQRQGKSVDERADLFALGAVAHEMLTGRPLFTGRQTHEIERDFTDWTPPDFRELAPKLSQAESLNQLLAVEPEQRTIDWDHWLV